MVRVVNKSNGKPWSGSIANASKDSKVYITAGSDIGLQVGAPRSRIRAQTR
jgi:hypothetical protein